MKVWTVRGPVRTKKSQQFGTKIAHTSGKIVDLAGVEHFRFLRSDNVEQYLWSIIPYTEKYTESESDNQNKDLLYKINQNCQNIFEFLEKLGKL